MNTRIHRNPAEPWHVEVDTDAGGRVEVEEQTTNVQIDVTDAFGNKSRAWMEPDEAEAIAEAILKWVQGVRCQEWFQHGENLYAERLERAKK